MEHVESVPAANPVRARAQYKLIEGCGAGSRPRGQREQEDAKEQESPASIVVRKNPGDKRSQGRGEGVNRNQQAGNPDADMQRTQQRGKQCGYHLIVSQPEKQQNE